jgi:ornithine--oxo-acid transaminase
MIRHAQTHFIGSEEAMELENKFGAHNYKPLPVVIHRGKGVHVWDPEGKEYYDFLSAYSALNQGHCHDRLLAVAREQMETLTLTSRAFYNDKLGEAERFLAETFDFDKTIMMNSGAEAVETALKLVRKWGYVNKGIREGKATIITAENNFHGRTIGIVSFSTDPNSKKGFGPFLPGFNIIPYNNTEALENALQNPDVCAFLIEPIQGEAGVIVPDSGYMAKARELCTKYNVLLVADEIQTGLGRTGKMLCCEYDDVKPDILILGKALSGGMMPISAVLCNDEFMNNLHPGEHGSTFGGNPLAAAITIEAVKIIQDENLVENAFELGGYFRERMAAINSSFIKEVRGKGLFNAVQINDTPESHTANRICLALKDNGLLAKETHGNIIRFAPPLIITHSQLEECCDIIERTFKQFGDLNKMC